jgi:hypothetical protein
MKKKNEKCCQPSNSIPSKNVIQTKGNFFISIPKMEEITSRPCPIRNAKLIPYCRKICYQMKKLSLHKGTKYCKWQMGKYEILKNFNILKTKLNCLKQR